METLLPPSEACTAKACLSTEATSTAVPSFEDAASTGVPTAIDGSGRTFITETITEGDSDGRRSIRLPTRLPPTTRSLTAMTEPLTGA